MSLRIVTPEAKPPQPRRADRPPVLCVASGKGGVGKTSLSLCIAREISKAKKVLVIDLDYFNRGATGLLRDQVDAISEGYSLIELLPLYGHYQPELGPEDGAPPIGLERVHRHPDLILCPCPELFQPIIQGIHDQPITELADALEFLIAWLGLAHGFGCVLIDAHGGPDPLSFAAAQVADHTMLVTEPDKVTLYGTLNFLAILRQQQLDLRSTRLHLIFNRVSSHFSARGLEGVYRRELVDLFDSPLLAMVPFDEEVFEHFGETPLITDLFPNSLFARKIASIVRRLLLEEHPELVPRPVREWSSWKARSVYRRLRQWSLARPAPIAILWLIALLSLFLVTTSSVFNTLGEGVWYNVAVTGAGLLAGIAGLLAFYNSAKLTARSLFKNLRFARSTPLQQLYAVKVALNGMILFLFSGVVLLGVGSLLAGVQAAREAARRAQCRNNLKQIGLALHNYYSVYDCFPAAFMPDREGRPMHSWRMALLPYMEQVQLYNAYNLSVPWNALENRTVYDTSISTYLCPSDTTRDSLHTNYAVVTGPGTLYESGKPTNPTIERITDGTSNTIYIVETKDTSFHWLEPRDLTLGPGGFEIKMSLTINDPASPSISSRHPGGVNVLIVDGSVRFLKAGIDKTILKALLSPEGGEVISSDSY
jgi:prepilin-type processing-associated H-X9-DG protein